MIVIAPISAKETNCSRFARFHHTFQRARLASSWGKLSRSLVGAASSLPVIGETIRGT